MVLCICCRKPVSWSWKWCRCCHLLRTRVLTLSNPCWLVQMAVGSCTCLHVLRLSSYHTPYNFSSRALRYIIKSMWILVWFCGHKLTHNQILTLEVISLRPNGYGRHLRMVVGFPKCTARFSATIMLADVIWVKNCWVRSETRIKWINKSMVMLMYYPSVFERLKSMDLIHFVGESFLCHKSWQCHGSHDCVAAVWLAEAGASVQSGGAQTPGLRNVQLLALLQLHHQYPYYKQIARKFPWF